ncbi:hypothetical protein MtrunA17_Chr1g0146821 [Medicago truncatula]|uniref:Uncharacterized protein n=1 Tax=Medicago truncatula TaxID=3880 RepID=I3T607_MEDTR|nr:unknown [Medicago truncatula]RHN76708.1 hypothetical protein MtrunA17_Chr1g0146821 [Medicago truncatula]
MDGHSKTLLPNPNFNCVISVSCVEDLIRCMNKQPLKQSHKGTHPRPGYRLCSIDIYGCSCHVA